MKVGDVGDGRFRAVTHYGITDKDIDEAVKVMRKAWKEMIPRSSMTPTPYNR